MSVVRRCLHVSLAGTVLSVSGFSLIAIAQAQEQKAVKDKTAVQTEATATQLQTITISGGQNGAFV